MGILIYKAIHATIISSILLLLHHAGYLKYPPPKLIIVRQYLIKFIVGKLIPGIFKLRNRPDEMKSSSGLIPFLFLEFDFNRIKLVLSF